MGVNGFRALSEHVVADVNSFIPDRFAPIVTMGTAEWDDATVPLDCDMLGHPTLGLVTL